jgi:hypothetical protein
MLLPGFRCREDIENQAERRISSKSLRSDSNPSFQLGADNLDNVVGSLFAGFRIAGHVVSNVVLHELGYETVDGTAGGGKALKRVGARLILVQRKKNAFELTDDSLGCDSPDPIFPEICVTFFLPTLGVSRQAFRA